MDLRAHDVLNLGSEACTAQGVRGVSWSVTLTDGTAWQGKLDELVPSGSRIRAYTSNAEVLYVTVDVTEYGSGHFCSLGEQRGPVGMPAMQPTAAPPSTLTKGQRTVAVVHDPQLTCTGGPDVRAEFSWTVTLNDGSIHFGYHTFDVKAGTTAERSYEWYPPNPDDPAHDFVATVENGQGPYGGSVNCAFRSQ